MIRSHRTASQVDAALSGALLHRSGFSARYATGAPLDAAGEATVALQQLGYKPVEVSRLVQKVAAEGDDAEAIIRKALRAALGS